MEKIIEYAASSSNQKQRMALEAWSELEGEEKIRTAIALFELPCGFIRETLLEQCTAEEISVEPWCTIITETLNDPQKSHIPELCQAILILISRMECDLSPTCVNFYRQCWDDEDIETRYQAFCTAEYREENSEDYLAHVRTWADDEDEDFRIVAAQAIERLRPQWGVEVLKKRAESAHGLEAFHTRMALVRMCDAQTRAPYVTQLIDDAENARYAFAAIQALFQYGTPEAIPALLRVARSFFGEPTVRVAAAAAAAKLGSDEGRKLLVKFSSARHGNPEYAKSMLGQIDGAKP